MTAAEVIQFKEIPEAPSVSFVNLFKMNSVAPPKPKRKSSNPDGTITIFYNNEVNFPPDFLEQI